jgi:quaternary ammonium compound-resistance protein SugE
MGTIDCGGVFEVGWAIGLKYTKIHAFVAYHGTVAAMVISVGLLGLAMKVLPGNVPRSVGRGAVGTAIPGNAVGRVCDFGRPLAWVSSLSASSGSNLQRRPNPTLNPTGLYAA